MQAPRPKQGRANERFHDRIAARYDEIYPAQDPYWKFYREITWRHLKPFLPSKTHAPVLDLGCGTGEWGIRFLKSGFTVWFVDLSQQMLGVCQKRVEEEVPRGEAHFFRADLVDLSMLPQGHFHFATAQGDPLSLCSDPSRALREIHQLLIPGAAFVGSIDNRCASYDHYMEKSNLAELEEFHRSGKTLWLAHKPQERFPVHTFSPAQIRKALERGGYETLDLIGKTILPVRKHPRLLESPESYRKILKIEEELHREEAYLGRASHLQFVARKKSD